MRYLLIWGSVLTNAALIISHPTSDFLNEVTDENILVGNAELTDSVADFKIEEALTDNSYPANNVASLAAACKDDDSLSTRSNDQLIAEEKVCPIRTPIKGSQGPANTPGNNGHRKGEPDLYRIMPQNRKDCEDGEIAICTRSFTIGDPIDRDYGYGPGVLPFVVEASQGKST